MAGEKDDDKKVGEEEEQYVAVEDPPAGKQQAADDDHDDDHGDDHDDDDGEGQQQDERLAGDQDDDDGDKQGRRKSENKARRARQRDARDRKDRELNYLRGRNEDLERRFSKFETETDARIAGSEIHSIDQGINKAKGDLALANQVISQAVEQKDGKNLTEALDHRDTIRDNLRQLEEAKDYMATNRTNGAGGAPQQPLDPRHVAHANQFMIDNEWWDTTGRDPDSMKVLEMDRSLVQEGYDPKTKDYWDELRARTEEALPHRFDSKTGKRDDDDDDARRGSGNGSRRPANKGPQFRTGGRERPLKRNEVYISPERKDAMIEAGIWDDPVARNSMLKRYAEYDRDAAEEAKRG